MGLSVYGPRVLCGHFLDSDHCPAAGEVTCVDMGECVMKSMTGRDHVGAFLVHGTCCVCRKVLVSSSMSKYIVISHIVTTIICIYLYFISPIFIYLTYHFIQRDTCFNSLCVLLLWCTVLWILIALFICCTCQKWRNKDVQSIIFCSSPHDVNFRKRKICIWHIICLWLGQSGGQWFARRQEINIHSIDYSG